MRRERNFKTEEREAKTSITQKEAFLATVLPRVAHIGCARELKERNVPVSAMLDMAVSLYIPFGAMADRFMVSAIVTVNTLRQFNITEDEAFKAAMANLDNNIVIDDTRCMLERMGMPVPEREEGFKLMVATNDRKDYGGSAILSKEFQSRMLKEYPDQRVFVIPSSVHEVLAIGEDFVEEERLSDMICDVNATMEPEDCLSDHPYIIAGTPEEPELMYYTGALTMMKQDGLMPI